MAGEHGGYRRPSSPAPTSGPGAISRRTDTGPAQQIRRLPNAGYGQSEQFVNLQKDAPLAQQPIAAPPSAPPSAGGGPPPGAAATQAQNLAQPPVPFGGASQRPNEPVTAGAAAGPGPGPEVLGTPAPQGQTFQTALQTLQSMAGKGNTEIDALLGQLQGGRL